MITLIPGENPLRLEIAFDDTQFTMDKRAEPKVEGYILMVEDNTWRPYDLNGNILGQDEKNPVDAAKKVIPNYTERARVKLTATLERMETEIAKAEPGLLRNARQKMADGIKAQLESGNF